MSVHSNMFFELYKNNLDGFKAIGGGHQFIAKCPFPNHDDRKASFSGEYEHGLWNCKGCGEKGNTYQFVKMMNLPNPHLYIVDDNNTNNYTYTPTPAPPKIDLSGKMIKFKNNLKNNMDKYPTDIWMSGFVDMDIIGVDDSGRWTFNYYDSDDKLINIKLHKSAQLGDGKCKWYNPQKIADMDRSKPLYLNEGEKDVLTLLSDNKQAISVSIGCNTMPTDKMLELIKDFKEIYVCYDNDDAGIKCGEKVANLIKHHQNKVSIIQWDKLLPDKYDVYDAYSKDKLDFINALTNAKEIRLKRKGFKMYDLNNFQENKYDSTEPIIDLLAYKGQTAMIGGEAGTKKSFVAMHCALSIASGVSLFDHFNTKPQKVVLIQFENENNDIQQRFKTMLEYYKEKSGSSNWIANIYVMELNADDEDFTDNWIRIEDTLNELGFSNGVLIVDNIYTSTDKEIQNNDESKLLLSEINRIRRTFNLTIILMAHCNKGTSVLKKLDKDQIQGGAILCSNIANVTMIGNSTLSSDLNIMKIVKGGRSEKNELLNLAFKLHWSDDSCTFTKGAIIKNEALHFQPMNESWEIKLIKYVSVNPEMLRTIIFDRDCFKRNLPKEYLDMGDTKLSRLLNRLIQWGLVRKVAHNKYQLELDSIEDFAGSK